MEIDKQIEICTLLKEILKELKVINNRLYSIQDEANSIKRRM